MIENLTVIIQSYQELKFEVINSSSLALKIWLSFLVLYEIAEGINFQMCRTLFFNLLLQTTKTSLMFGVCTQLTPIKERDKRHKVETH